MLSVKFYENRLIFHRSIQINNKGDFFETHYSLICKIAHEVLILILNRGPYLAVATLYCYNRSARNTIEHMSIIRSELSILTAVEFVWTVCAVKHSIATCTRRYAHTISTSKVRRRTECCSNKRINIYLFYLFNTPDGSKLWNTRSTQITVKEKRYTKIHSTNHSKRKRQQQYIQRIK